MNQVKLDELVKPHTCVVMASNCICHSTVFHRINIATEKNTKYYPRDRKACMDSLERQCNTKYQTWEVERIGKTTFEAIAEVCFDVKLFMCRTWCKWAIQQKKNTNKLFWHDENSIDIVHHCYTWLQASSGSTTWSVLLTTLNNVGSKTLFNAIFIRSEQVVRFWLCKEFSSFALDSAHVKFDVWNRHKRQ